MKTVIASILSLGMVLGEGRAVAGQQDPRLDGLFAGLRAAADAAAAARIEQEIWEIWFEMDDPTIAERLSLGVEAMNRRDFQRALGAFDAVIAADSKFAEGFNRRATLYYLMGNFEASVTDIGQTLALEPRHFGALSGLALIREAQRRPFEALEALEKVMQIHPRMQHLTQRVNHLTRQLGDPI